MEENNENKYVQNNMARYLRPERFEEEPSATASDLKWTHWYFTFQNFLSEECSPNASDSMKLKLLVNHLSPTIFSYIRASKSYDEAVSILQKLYIKPKNEILARHMLATRRQRADETIKDYVQALKLLALECHFTQVSAEDHQKQSMRGAFIAGISSQKIRERLLEKLNLSLDEAVNLAISLEDAGINSQAFGNTNTLNLNALPDSERPSSSAASTHTSYPNSKRRCFFCGGNVHQRLKCPAANENCQLCSKKGHFANVCRSKQTQSANAVTDDNIQRDDTLSAISAASPSSLRKATSPITINGFKAEALIDTGSSVSFINKSLVEILKLKIKPSRQTITLASLSHVSYVQGVCYVNIQLEKHQYKNQSLLIVNNLCADAIIGHDILKNHSSLELEFGGTQEPLRICNVMEASVPPASLFTHLSPHTKPIAVRSRHHTADDERFIKTEVSKLLEDGIIEPSVSPWRAQVLIAGGGLHKKRMVIDYSQTINKYTELDAFPLPKIETIVAKAAKYNYFSQIDLKSAYHQVPILQKERIFTAFEANGKLYQFTRIPFGVTNGVAAFQRTLNYIIEEENLSGTFAYLDDVTVCGKTKEEHDANLSKFKAAAAKYNLTLNESKSVFSQESINLLGYTIQNNTIRPDENRLKPLLDLPAPENTAAMKRALGFFAHYSRWIPNFSERIKPLLSTCSFPLSESATTSFNELKRDIAKASLSAINENAMFTVETDASENALAASLSQNGQPVAYFSRSLNDSERRHSSIEKEAAAIVEALRKWRHYLIGRHFLLITDQQSVAFMFNQIHSSKIKNEKIERWRLELSCFKYDIIYRPGKENIVADALTRVCAHMDIDNLKTLHDNLCHPGIVRMNHWVRSKNLPYSVHDIRQMTANCKICAEIKPRYANTHGRLIKATAPLERLNIDFKGPLPSKSRNKYILTVIDEYSRFPFAFACKDMTSSTVINCLNEIFYTFGTPMYIHSDRGTSFMSQEITQYLVSLGIACSRTTPYNPQGNGQVEHLNFTLWRTIQLSLKSKGLEIADWERVLPLSLHAIRSLLCTATNATPHDRMFSHPRRSPNGVSLPAWLTAPGPILIKRSVRSSKYDPTVEEGYLLQSNPTYSHIRYPDGREGTISNRHLAPIPSDDEYVSISSDDNDIAPEAAVEEPSASVNDSEETADEEPGPSGTPQPVVRRSARVRRAPAYLEDYDYQTS